MKAALGLSESATRRVVAAAGQAPSLFNTQPWRFRLAPDRIEIHPDRGRGLIAHDPDDRELRIACGAALFNLRLALHAHGVTPVVIGANDWAAAWAIEESGAPMYPVGRGISGERQRELAVRFGINLIMYVMTGNYKSDQVHVPALLDRLGQ